MNIFKTSEYALKLDYFYYDDKKSSIIVVIKIRNKRVTYNSPIQKILSDKQALSSLHPIDLCILGILYNSTALISRDNKSNLARIIDGFHMAKIAPFLQVIGRENLNEDEVITLKLKHINKITHISVIELYKNKNLINALQYQDAISLGCSLSNFDKLLYEQITQKKDNYQIKYCLINGIYLSALILSILLSSELLKISVLNYQLEFRAEILFLPFIILLQNEIRKTHGIKFANILFMTIIGCQIIFIGYFGIIAKLPCPESNFITDVFNNFYKIMITHSWLFIVNIYAAWLLFYLIYSVTHNLFKKRMDNQVMIVIDLVIFFTISLIVSSLTNNLTYSSSCIGYSILIMIATRFFIFSTKWIVNKWSH